jgi:hypothetical protein
MSIIDRFLQVSNNQAITVNAVSTDVIDAGATKNAAIGRDLGGGTQLFMEICVTATMTGAGTLAIALQDSADNSSFADVLTLPPIAFGSLVVGTRLYIPLPAKMRRYIRNNYTIASGPFTGGTLSAQVVDGMTVERAYPDSLSKVV